MVTGGWKEAARFDSISYCLNKTTYSQWLKNKYKRKKFVQVTLCTVFWFYILKTVKTGPS